LQNNLFMNLFQNRAKTYFELIIFD